jgi:hypothetical protein
MKMWNNFTLCRENATRSPGIALTLVASALWLTGCVAGPTPHPSDPEDPTGLLQDEGEDGDKANEATGADAFMGGGTPESDGCADALTFDACDPPNVAPDTDGGDVGPDGMDGASDGGDVGPDGMDGAGDGGMLDPAADGDDGGNGSPAT